jgi:hypothetical protein
MIFTSLSKFKRHPHPLCKFTSLPTPTLQVNWWFFTSLKIKIFMWFLHRNVILTKDNLAKRNWNGCKKYVFLWFRWINQPSLFLLFLRSFSMESYSIYFQYSAPTNIKNMFGNWLNGVNKKDKTRIRIGICALMWAIWNYSNDIIFNKCSNVNLL